MKIMKKIRKKGKKIKRIGSHGIITVFLTLMMVPVVAISSVMVDVARLNLYSSQAVMAADTYGDAVLSEFDNLLKSCMAYFQLHRIKRDLRQSISLRIRWDIPSIRSVMENLYLALCLTRMPM